MQARLTSKGQLTLPFAARARLGLKAGDHLSVTVQDDDSINPLAPPALQLPP
jgi:AbrB family looped-hinge helix DNA binding protein